MLVCSKHMLTKFRLQRPEGLTIYLPSKKADIEFVKLNSLLDGRPSEKDSQVMLIAKIKEFKACFGEL